MPQVNDSLFQAILAGVGVIVWLVRLEGKIHAVEKANHETQKDVDDLRVRHETLDSEIVEQLSNIRESLARLEGSLGIKQKRGD
jgi:hypothetical protein